MEVSANYTGFYYAGTGLTLNCNTTIDTNVDNNEEVTITWSSPMNISGERYSVTSLNDERSSLTISPLAEEDGGQYMCNMTVSGSTYVKGAISSDDITINVEGND